MTNDSSRTFDVADRWLAASIGIRQPLLDSVRLFYNAPALRKDAKAALLLATRNSELYAAEVARRYFTILEIDAQHLTLDSQKKYLANHLKRTRHISSSWASPRP